MLASINPFMFFTTSDLAGQIIFLVLCALSLVAWSTMIGKYLQLKRLRDNNARFAADMAKSDAVAHTPTTGYDNCPYAELTQGALSALERANELEVSPSAQMNHVENAIQRALNSICIKYESKMILLGSIVSGAPFLGLLGTVWGVMIAFGGIATQNGPATIQALAPGVAGALLTTVAGLLVAIPAVFGYNYLLTRTKVMVTELENFASALADRVELEHLGSPAKAASAPTHAFVSPTPKA
jgi:biopolymer transport protein TolQ